MLPRDAHRVPDLTAPHTPLLGLPTPVDLPVPEERRAHSEALPAVGTGVGTLPGVDAPVLDEVGALPKAVPAVSAGVGPLPRVDPVVPEQG